MTLFYRPMLPILILSAGTPLLYGQAMIERGIIDGKTAAAAAGAGKSMVGVLRQMGNATDAAAKGTPAPPPPRASAPEESAPPSAPATPLSAVNSSVIISGMERAELVKLLGRPSMSVSGVEANALTETYWYQTSTESVTVILRDGKVFSVRRIAKS